MPEQVPRGWAPPVIGVIALLLAADRARSLTFIPPDMTEELVLGVNLTGRAAWAASIILMLLCAWISAGCFRRRRDTVWVVIGFLVYTALSYCAWLLLYSPQNLQTNLISGAFVTAFLLALCRFVFDRRSQFDQD
jgi:hypothetical protein